MLGLRILLGLALVSCSNRITDNAGGGELAIVVGYSAAAKTYRGQATQRMVATILDGARVVLAQELSRTDGRWRASIALDNGAYTVVLEAYVLGEVLWRGQSDAQVRRGNTTKVEILLDRLYQIAVSQEVVDFQDNLSRINIELSNKGSGEGLRWTVFEQVDWLEVEGQLGETDLSTPGEISGIGRAELRLVVDRNGLVGGDHEGQLHIRSNGGHLDLLVQMVVNATLQPQLNISRTEIQVGPARETNQLMLENIGTGELIWRLAEAVDWLEVRAGLQSSEAGEISHTGPALLELFTDGESLTPGSYLGVVQITSNGGDINFSVKLDVPDPGSETAIADLAVEWPGGFQVQFIWIKPGTFLMGSPADEMGHSANEEPVHSVEISRGFFISQTEITQRQWREVMGENPSRFVGDDRPVESVSWTEIQGFIEQLNLTQGDSSYRLPTEAEWEYAARAGTSTPWSFSRAEADEFAWFESNNELGAPRQVGLKRPNPWKLHDMHGNVWEWVEDWYGEAYYATSAATDPPGPNEGTDKVLRGGAFNRDLQSLRSADRLRFHPDERSQDIGFRLVRR